LADLDDLLREFQAATAAQQPPPPVPPDVEAVRQHARAVHAQTEAGLLDLKQMREQHEAELARLKAEDERREAEHREALATRNDIERAVAAVRNVDAGGESPDKAASDRLLAQRIINMDDHQYRAWQKSQGGVQPSVYMGWGDGSL
jgi:hypothetical protein